VADLSLISEFNNFGVLLHFVTLPGAYTRGATEMEAYSKAAQEAALYCEWAEMPLPKDAPSIAERKEAQNGSRLADADTEILLSCDRLKLDIDVFDMWCELAIRSATSFDTLYDSIRDKDWVQAEKLRPAFYGKTPATAREMLFHADVVSEYYLSRIGLRSQLTEGKLLENRKTCVETLRANYNNEFNIFEADQELWTETKVLRRYIWHDRVHGKALYRHGLKMGMDISEMVDTFGFEGVGIIND